MRSHSFFGALNRKQMFPDGKPVLKADNITHVPARGLFRTE